MIDMIFYDCEGKWLLLADATKVWGKISCRLDKKHHMRYKSYQVFLFLCSGSIGETRLHICAA